MRAPVQFPPDRRPAKPLADASCCASMQRSENKKLDFKKLSPFKVKKKCGLFIYIGLSRLKFEIHLWLPLTSLSWKGGDGKGNN